MINFGFLLLLLIGLTSTHPNSPPVFAKVGERVRLSCFYQSQMAMHFSWYKHKPGLNPSLISTIYKYDKTPRFYHDFQNNPRFSVLNENGLYHLVIRNVQLSDSASYYCGSSYSNVMEIVNGTELRVQGLENGTVLPHSGDSVSLTCTVLNPKCVGNHSVLWLILESQESHPRMMRAHGWSSDQCDQSAKAAFPVWRCVFSFWKKDLSLSDSQTHFCTVAACGEMLTGNNSKLDITGADSTEQMMTLVLMSIGRILLLLLIVAVVASWYCMNSKRISKDVRFPSDVTFQDLQSRAEGRDACKACSTDSRCQTSPDF